MPAQLRAAHPPVMTTTIATVPPLASAEPWPCRQRAGHAGKRSGIVLDAGTVALREAGQLLIEVIAAIRAPGAAQEVLA